MSRTNTKYQYENLLRDPYERVSGSMYYASAAIMGVFPEILMMPSTVAYAGAAVLFIKGTLKFKKAHKLRKYQKSLLYIRPFTKSSKQIGASRQHLWLGLGFQWNQRHAQRMHDLSLAKNAHFIEHSPWYKKVRKFERHNEHKRGVIGLFVKFTKSQSRFNPYPPIPDLGGKFQLQGVGMWEGEEDVVLPLANRNGHMLVLGTTRVGKTRFLEVLVAQDIRRGEVVVVIDPKGDADLLLRMYAECKAVGREDDFHIFHLGYPEASEAYNPIGSFMRSTEVASRIAGQMPSGGQSATFKDFVWGYVNTIAVALIKMGVIPTYALIKSYSADFEALFNSFMQWYYAQHPATKDRWEEEVANNEEEFSKKAEERNDEFKKNYKSSKIMMAYKARTQAVYKFYSDNVALIQCTECDMMSSKINYDKTHLDKLTASLHPFLDKLTTGDVSKLLVPSSNSSKQFFNWNDIIQNGGVVYVGLDALSDSEVAGAVGNSMFADLTSIAGRIYKSDVDHGLPMIQGNAKAKGRKICIHADEFNELIGPEFIPMLNKAGGAGIQVAAYTQTLPDIEARLGSAPKAGQVIGNLNTLVMLRVIEESTVKLMTNRHRKVQVVTNDIISGSSDVSDPNSDQTFTSNVTQRSTMKDAEMINPEDLLSLPVGQAYVEIQGNRLYKIRMPLPDGNDLKGIPSNILDLAENMRKTYQSSTKTFKQIDTVIKIPAMDSSMQTFLQQNSSQLQNEIENWETELDKRDNSGIGAVNISIHGAEDVNPTDYDGSGSF